MDSDSLLEKLYALSGIDDRGLDAEAYFLVAKALTHDREDVRERAIFIGGLRWMDKVMLGYFKGVLLSGAKESDGNRRLMVESLVSEAIVRGGNDDGDLQKTLAWIVRSYGKETLAAKAAYIGTKRLNGQISKNEFAIIDYDDVRVLDE